MPLFSKILPIVGLCMVFTLTACKGETNDSRCRDAVGPKPLSCYRTEARPGGGFVYIPLIHRGGFGSTGRAGSRGG